MTRRITALAGCLAALTLSACASTPPTPETQTPETQAPEMKTPDTTPTERPTPPASTQVTGTVRYRERIALSPEAVVQVEVVEVSAEGRPGDVVGTQTLRSPGQVPIPFSVDVPSERIRADATYLVRARITDGARTFSTPEPITVLTQGGRTTDVEVLLRSGN
ncbi:YbaY family lipoprotein [Hyalangium rubrum]|uniref:YbaY family lipoprotein n=1 Tax=Hyalangium rubrum TaxID=3103134 RepID=A0ABU5HI78_9BACT|nr:YbaY family lipoprotein [Hyalangium sp. s54d21]MDY7232951.1 YbaY family lipoprotein [Hyalangium sp. s54d21]